jgi:hypothetical protein
VNQYFKFFCLLILYDRKDPQVGYKSDDSVHPNEYMVQIYGDDTFCSNHVTFFIFSDAHHSVPVAPFNFISTFFVYLYGP